VEAALAVGGPAPAGLSEQERAVFDALESGAKKGGRAYFAMMTARPQARRAYPNLIYFHEADKGGHFAAWEEPELFSAEVRAAFSSLR